MGRQEDGETRRQGDGETGRQGDGETGRGRSAGREIGKSAGRQVGRSANREIGSVGACLRRSLNFKTTVVHKGRRYKNFGNFRLLLTGGRGSCRAEKIRC